MERSLQLMIFFQHTHELKVHKLVVKVDGWQKVTPVSVDKVGIYFRQAKPEINKAASIVSNYSLGLSHTEAHHSKSYAGQPGPTIHFEIIGNLVSLENIRRYVDDILMVC